MAIVTTDSANYTAIAEAIRSKTGSTDTYTPAQMAAAIAGIVSGGAVTGLAYDMGEFVLDTDIKKSTTGVNHNLGEKPEFILVWTDDFAGITADNPAEQQCNIGYVWFDRLSGMSQRLTSTATGSALTINFSLTNGDYRIFTATPNSLTYTVTTPDAESFSLHPTGASNYWRAGVTYKYFVSKAWWNVGGVASAD